MILQPKKELSTSNTNSLPKKLAIYLRVSTKKQDDNTSKDTQLKSIFSLIEANGWTGVPYEIYEDTMSASIGPKVDLFNSNNEDLDSVNPSIFLRDGIRRLFFDATYRGFDKLLVYSHDRLSRDTYESFIIKHSLNKYNIDILYSKAGEQFNSENNSMNTFLENLLSNLSSLESNIIGGRTFLGNRGNIIKNLWAGGPPPYGYSLTPLPSNRRKTKLVIKPYEARIVQKIFRLYSIGYATEDIISFIKAEYKYNNDRLWTNNSIKSILSNPVYTGIITWNKKGGRRNPIKRDSSQYTYSKFDATIQIIDNSLWEKVKMVKTIQVNDPKFLSTDFLLKELIFCGECGNSLKTKNHGNTSGSVYYCRHNNKPEINIPTLSLKSSILHSLVLQELEKLLNSLLDTKSNLEDLYNNYYSKTVIEKEALTNEAMSLQNDISNINTMTKKSIIKLDELKANPVANDNITNYNKYLYLLSSIEEYINHLSLINIQLSEKLALINLKCSTPFIPIENFRDHIINKLEALSTFLNEKNTKLKNRCLRLLFVDIIASIKIYADSTLEINLK